MPNNDFNEITQATEQRNRIWWLLHLAINGTGEECAEALQRLYGVRA